MTLKVSKTVKMYVGGAFIRSESGATVPFINNQGKEMARVCVTSIKDLRNTVEKAKLGHNAWAKCSAYLKSQIIYRMAEMAQSKIQELQALFQETLGMNEQEALKMAQDGIDTFVYYAGWCDKYQQAMGAVNPVNGPFHNFTTSEPMGVVALIDSMKFSFPKLIDNICSILVSGNSVIALVSPECSPLVTTLGEIMATSDLPAGAVNLLSGNINSLKEHFASHMEVKAISFQNEDQTIYSEIRRLSTDNMKRVIPFTEKEKSLELVLNFVEHKTIWHPIGQ